MKEPGEPSCRTCVVIPTYNNAETLGDIVRAALTHTADLVVVDDGSTDETADVLAGFENVTVIRHERNRGKGAALRSGLTWAWEHAFTHAVTLDADGQHFPDDIPKIRAAIAENPDAFIIGVRDLTGRGPRRKSRWLRANSNFWTWVATGQWVEDTQSGFRVYPLAVVSTLDLRTRKYDFEIEVLELGMWMGAPVVGVPVRVEYGPNRKSHFRPLRDFALVFILNTHLILQRIFLPDFLLKTIHLKAWRDKPLRERAGVLMRGFLLQQCHSAGAFAAAVGVGVVCGILPVWGFQTAVAVVAAHRLRLSKPLTVAASNISFPAMIPLILFASLVVGHLAFTGEALGWGGLRAMTKAEAWHYAFEYVAGSLMLAGAAGLVIGLIAYGLARVYLRQHRG